MTPSVSGTKTRNRHRATFQPAIAYGDPFDSKHSFSLRMTGILNAIAEWGITPCRDPPPIVILSKGRSPASKDLFLYVKSAEKPVAKRAAVSSVSGDMSRSMYHASSRPAIAYGDPFDSKHSFSLRMTGLGFAIASAGTHDPPYCHSERGTPFRVEESLSPCKVRREAGAKTRGGPSVSGNTSRNRHRATFQPAVAYGDPFDSKHSFSLRMTKINWQ